MADIWFGADVPVVAENGNWNQLNQWYSDPGYDNGKGSVTAGTLLNRLPRLDDLCYIMQTVTTGVVARALTLTTGVSTSWSGRIAPWNDGRGLVTGVLADPTATWTSSAGGSFLLAVSSGTINFNLSTPGEITGGIFNGPVTNVIGTIVSGATFNGAFVTNDGGIPIIGSGVTFNSSVSGNISLTVNPTFGASSTLTNIRTLTLTSNVTFTKAITSWASPNFGLIFLNGSAVYNSPSTPTANLRTVLMYGGTMSQNIFTSSYTSLNLVNISGGTLNFAGDMVFGAPGRPCTVNINTQNFTPFAGTNKNITIYQNPATNPGATWGTTSFGGKDAGTYTGLITFISSTGTGNVIISITGGTYIPPVQTFPLVNVAFGTGKGVDVSSQYRNWGFSSYTQRVSISGSSDILQSGLA